MKCVSIFTEVSDLHRLQATWDLLSTINSLWIIKLTARYSEVNIFTGQCTLAAERAVNTNSADREVKPDILLKSQIRKLDLKMTDIICEQNWGHNLQLLLKWPDHICSWTSLNSISYVWMLAFKLSVTMGNDHGRHVANKGSEGMGGSSKEGKISYSFIKR